jgi:adenosine deaminase
LGHGVRITDDLTITESGAAQHVVMGSLAEWVRDRRIALEICPTSNLMTQVVKDWDEFRQIFDALRKNKVRYVIGTDGPEMLQTYIRDELAALGRHGILSVEEQEIAAAMSIKASFVKNASKAAIPRSAGTSPRTLKEEV